MSAHTFRTENQPVLSGGKGGNWRTVLPVYTGGADGRSPCACCGWVGPNNRPVRRADTEQEAVLCPLCVLSTVLPHTLTKGKGRLVIVPELTQTEINNLYRWGFLGLYAKQCLADGTSWLKAEGNSAYEDKAGEMAPLSALLRELDSLFAQRGGNCIAQPFSCRQRTQRDVFSGGTLTNQRRALPRTGAAFCPVANRTRLLCPG